MHAALETLEKQAGRYPLDLQRLVAVGHSAGGQLVQWMAGRARIPAGSPLYRAQSLKVPAVVSLGGLADLRKEAALIKSSCGRDTAELAGVPAVEVRAISNELGEPDRSRWDLTGGLEALEDALPRLVTAVTA